jgi:uncharacterized protein
VSIATQSEEAAEMRLDADMQRVVREQRLGFVATVCRDGTPNLSPKGTTIVWDDDHLAFLHIHSATTVANLAANPAIEINVVDPIRRKGYRFKGWAVVLMAGEQYAEIVEYFRNRGTDVSRVRAVVLVEVEHAAPLVSPAYDSGVDEAEVIAQWRDHHLRLADARLRVADD